MRLPETLRLAFPAEVDTRMSSNFWVPWHRTSVSDPKALAPSVVSVEVTHVSAPRSPVQPT